MKSKPLREMAALEALAPKKKCEWCSEPSQRQADLCLSCEDRWLRGLLVPGTAGPEGQVVLGIRRSCGVFW